MKNKVIQFGEGGFLRGFVDWMLQKLNEETSFEGGVVVVQPIENGMCQMLEAQGCNYTHLMRGLKNGKPTVEEKHITVIQKTVEPYKDFQGYLQLAEDPDFRFVVSNTTEAGITYKKGETPADAPAVTFPAKVALLLKRRFEKGLGGFIFLPCELIEKNGDTLKACILKYAADWGWGAEFAKWVEEENVFYNTLVDRIVTGFPREEAESLGYNDNMLNTSELFHLWVLQGSKDLLKELPFDQTDLNVIITEDLDRYRTRKVRILNGAHTSMIPYALLSGLETVEDCMKDEKMSAFLKACVFDEIIPTLDLPKEELEGYAADVFERFRNPYIRHLCSSIALNSVSKFKVRVLPSLLEYRNRMGKNPPHLMLSFAKLIEFYRTDMVNDDPAVAAFMKTASVGEILANTQLWDQDLSFLKEELEGLVC